MLNKRQFMGGCAALGASLSVSPPLHAGQPLLALAVADSRFSDAAAFAGAAPCGRMLDSGGDLALHWPTLHQMLRRPETGRIAGLLTHADFDIIRLLAAEHGRRIVFECHHDCRGGRTLRHGVRSMLDMGDDALFRQTDWPARLARRLAAAPVGAWRTAIVKTEIRRQPDHPGHLISWAIA